MQIADKPVGSAARVIIECADGVVGEHGNQATESPVFLIEEQKVEQCFDEWAGGDRWRGVKGVWNTEAVEDLADARRRLGKRAEDDEDVAGANWF